MDDKPETPVNPYQSPRAGAASQDAAHPERAYGLREPIRAEGKLSAEDVWPTEKPTLGQWVRRRGGWYVVAGVVGVLVALQGNASGFGLPTTMAFAGVLATIVGGVFVLVCYTAIRRNREFERNTCLERTTIGDRELVVAGERGRSVWRWSAFCQCRCSDQQVLLFVDPDGYRLVLPRRFFAHEGDWEAFVDLVRFKLPEDDASTRQLAETPRELVADQSTSAEKRGETEDGEGPSPLIQVEGSLSWKDWRHIQNRVRRAWLGCAMRTGCLAPFVAILAMLFWPMRSMGLAWPLFIPLAVIILFVFNPLFVSSRLKLRRRCKRQEGPFEPFQIRIWEDRVQYAESTSTATIPWTAFNRLMLTDRVVLLYESRPNIVRFIPRAFFASDEEWERLVEFVRRKLSDGSDEAPNS